jgi:hypothetical protein
MNVDILAQSPSVSPGPMMAFIDLENLCLSAREIDAKFDIGELLDELRRRAPLIATYAYGDFVGAWYEHYRRPLLQAGVQQVQLGRWSPKYQKNRADIRLAIDVTRTMIARPDVATFAIVSGDSDLSELAVLLREARRRVICAAYRHSAGEILRHLCDEFIDLTPQPDDAAQCPPRFDGAALLRSALWIASQEIGEAEVPAARLKPIIRKIEPTFDEKRLGYANFKAFLEAHGDVVRIVERASASGLPRAFVRLASDVAEPHLPRGLQEVA